MRHAVVRDVVIAALVTGATYFVSLGHRSDLLGHYLAGFGATLLLLCALAVKRPLLSWNAFAVTIASIGVGFVTETSVFRFAFFDPVDFANQSIGACVACACVLETRLDGRVVRTLAVAGIVLLTGGFVFAFA